ncbi:hypothetical protein [Streptomyces sp. NPDC001594]|uniref:hypothetical protein n=1 Tax=Streptomyces sp. NPDC001594 TaxID=3364590 RepID=UPI00368CB84B
MGYIVIGQGDLQVDRANVAEGMEIVAVPQHVTLRAYFDEGKGLRYGPGLDVFGQLSACPEISGDVSVNLALHAREDLKGAELAEFLHHVPGYELIRPGFDGWPNPLLLCTDQNDVCPKSAADLEAGKSHQCSGVLSVRGGDVIWLACTWLAPAADVEGHTVAEDWVPDEATREATDAYHRRAVAEVDGHRTFDCTVSPHGFAFGRLRDTPYGAYLRRDGAECSLTLVKEQASDGSTSVTWAFEGCPAEYRRYVSRELERYPADECSAIQYVDHSPPPPEGTLARRVDIVSPDSVSEEGLAAFQAMLRVIGDPKIYKHARIALEHEMVDDAVGNTPRWQKYCEAKRLGVNSRQAVESLFGHPSAVKALGRLKSRNLGPADLAALSRKLKEQVREVGPYGHIGVFE